MRRLRSLVPRQLFAGPLAVLGIGIVAFATFFGMTGTSVATTPVVSTSPAVIAAGQALYNEHCSSCHGVNGSGSVRAPELYSAGAAAADFYLTTGRMPLNAVSNQAQAHRPYFNPTQISQIVSYVASLPGRYGNPNIPGPGIPTLLPLCPSKGNVSAETTADAQGTGTCVTLSFGQQTFALNCASCHQIAGAGGMLSGANVIPSLDNPTSTQVLEAIRVGPKPMPIFGPGQLSEQQISAIAHYVKFLQTPKDDLGGLRISGFGPVAEGFVGIVIGFGLLLFVSRLIGNRG
jgi:ubiquinol-cytochrome c reductase cytochrome c subunit